MLGEDRVPLERRHAALDEQAVRAPVRVEATLEVALGEIVRVEAVVPVAPEHAP